MRKSTSDIGSGAGFLAIAAAFFFQYSDAEGVSRIFPETLISIIAAGGVWYLAKGLLELRGERAAKNTKGTAEDTSENWPHILWVSFMAVAYAVAIPTLGYWWATGIFLAVTYLGLVFKNGNIVKSLILAALFGGGFSFLVWLGFVRLMSVPTPEGVLW